MLLKEKLMIKRNILKTYILIFYLLLHFVNPGDSQKCLISNLDSFQETVKENLRLKLNKVSNNYKPRSPDLFYEDIRFFFEESNFCDFLPDLIKENNKWKKLFIIYHFSEGESNRYFITYLFANGRHSKSFTYDAALDKWHKATNVKAKTIEKFKVGIEYVDASFILINSFDKKLRPIKSKIYIGPPIIEQEEQLFKIYFQDKVYN